MYKKVDTNLNFAEKETGILKFWNDNRIFEKSMELRKDAPDFTFYEGPPTANGAPHIGHVITRTVKDIVLRYRTMKGYNCLRKGGWDTHGLPVELEVERELKISGKPDIEKYGVEPFIKRCKESVWKYEKQWRLVTERVGFWVDMDDPYVTYHNSYIESVWWSLKQIWDKGLLYKGHKVVPYCPRCGTALSSHEVAQGYKDIRETSVYARFKVKNEPDTYILAWTTTPWTLPSNVALVVNADMDYGRFKTGDGVYIMAQALAGEVLAGEYETLEIFKGKALEYLEYEPLFDFYDPDRGEKAFYVCCDDYVVLTEGTGVVHTAPAFGEDDARVGKQYGLPFVQFVDERGCFTDEAYLWKGVFVKDADPLIIKHMAHTGQLYKKAVFEHSYPFCWRCETPLLYYARDTWFIAMSRMRRELVDNNNTVNWLPDNIRTGRFGNFLENVIDWGLSRERYWGTPLPIWECACGHTEAVGSVAELREKNPSVPADIELHKPYIDSVSYDCPECGGRMKRVPEVIDCWYDSGAMPFAQWHYPFENIETFERHFPADFITEAVDQTRGWFYSQMAISTLLFGKSNFRNCIVLGHVQDKQGRKMSKHLGNGVDPWDALNKYGADAVRWYFMVNSSPWLPSRFFEEAVIEAGRRFLGTLWNTYAFYALYAEIDQFNPFEHELDYNTLTAMDRWILSKLNTLIKEVDGGMNSYHLTEPARALAAFVDELSNWYVRRCRERFWAGGMEADKVGAYMTLHTALVAVVKLAAPFVPFITEEIYQNLVTNLDKGRADDQYADKSVHLCDFPTPRAEWDDAALEEGMDAALRIVTCGRAARNGANIKNRQPIGLMRVKLDKDTVLDRMYVDIIAEELNIKRVVFSSESLDGYVTYKFKPQLKTLGPRYGKLLPRIAEYLNNVDGRAFMEELKCGGAVLIIDGEPVDLAMEDVLVEVKNVEGYMTESDRGVTVVLETALTPELIEEGFVREIVSKTQTMRKEAGFEVTDRIKLYHKGSESLAGVFERNRAEIAADVLADDIIGGEAEGHVMDWDINGQSVTLGVKKS